MEGNSEQGKAVSDLMSGIAEGFKKLVQPRGEDANIGFGTTEPLSKLYTDGFGTFVERKVYDEGCDIEEVVDKEGRVVRFTTEDGNVVRAVEISKTPQDHDPKNGGKVIPDAGNPNDYLLAMVSRDNATQKTKEVFRYLDKSEITGAIIRKGQQANLEPFMQDKSGRYIVIRGVVNSVTALK